MIKANAGYLFPVMFPPEHGNARKVPANEVTAKVWKLGS